MGRSKWDLGGDGGRPPSDQAPGGQEPRLRGAGILCALPFSPRPATRSPAQSLEEPSVASPPAPPSRLPWGGGSRAAGSLRNLRPQCLSPLFSDDCPPLQTGFISLDSQPLRTRDALPSVEGEDAFGVWVGTVATGQGRAGRGAKPCWTAMLALGERGRRRPATWLCRPSCPSPRKRRQDCGPGVATGSSGTRCAPRGRVASRGREGVS